MSDLMSSFSDHVSHDENVVVLPDAGSSDGMPDCALTPRRTKCGKQRVPGRGETGCAFQGAKRALQPITDAAHLVHGLASCEGSSWTSRPTASTGSHLHRTSFTTDLTEKDVIQGGEGKLLNAIGEIIEQQNPSSVFVYQTCLPAMTGDDVVAVCKLATQRWALPVIAVDSPGFAGSRLYGGHCAVQTLMRHVIGTREPDDRTTTDINLIGEFNVAGELEQVRPLLAALGIRVLSTISGDGRFHDIAMAHRARAAVSICSEGLPRMAQSMRSEFGIPFVEGNFYGVASTSETLRKLSRLLADVGGPRDLPDRTEALIRREEERVNETLNRYRVRLAGKRVMLMAVGVKAWSMATMLKDAGMELVGASVGGVSGDEPHQVGGPACAASATEGSIEAIDAFLRRGEADIVLSGGNCQFLALKAVVPWLEINHQRTIPLTCYGGTLALLDAIDRTLSAPIWRQLRADAPWTGMIEQTTQISTLPSRSSGSSSQVPNSSAPTPSVVYPIFGGS